MSDVAPEVGAFEEYEGPHPGLAAERTDLAWSRSGLAVGACGLIVLKGLPSITGSPSEPIIGGVILLLGAITWGLGRWSAHRRRPRPGRPRPVAVTSTPPNSFSQAMMGSRRYREESRDSPNSTACPWALSRTQSTEKSAELSSTARADAESSASSEERPETNSLTLSRTARTCALPWRLFT